MRSGWHQQVEGRPSFEAGASSLAPFLLHQCTPSIPTCFGTRSARPYSPEETIGGNLSFRPFAAGKPSVNPRCPPFMTQGVGSGHSMTAIKEGHAASLAASQAGFTKSIGDDADADGAGHGLNERVLPRQNIDCSVLHTHTRQQRTCCSHGLCQPFRSQTSAHWCVKVSHTKEKS